MVPVYDEQENIEPLYREIVDAMTPTGLSFEILFVDDGSRDRTLERLRLLVAGEERVRALRLGRNFGQATAIQAGFDQAAGDILVTLDGDLQNDPADIPRLLEELRSGYDLVAGWRKHRQDSTTTRLLPSLVANWLIARLTGVRIHDNGCTLRAYRRELIEKNIIYADMHRFMVPMLTRSGAYYKEIVVHHRPRRSGSSKYGLSRIWKVLLDLLAIMLLTRFVSHPAAWFAVLSFPFFVLSILAGGISLANFLGDQSTNGVSLVSSSMSLITLFTAFNLFFYGLLAEMVVRHGEYSEADPLLRRIERRSYDA